MVKNMCETFKRLALIMPIGWISDPDRDWAMNTRMILSAVEESFESAVAAFVNFIPLSYENFENSILRTSRYHVILNRIYIKEYVLSLDTLNKLFCVMMEDIKTPISARDLIAEYQDRFGHIRYIRDSIAHIEDRIRLLDRFGNRLPAKVVLLGALSDNKFGFTGSDGRIYSIEISESVLNDINRITQGIIDSYYWDLHGLTKR